MCQNGKTPNCVSHERKGRFTLPRIQRVVFGYLLAVCAAKPQIHYRFSSKKKKDEQSGSCLGGKGVTCRLLV